MQKYGKTKEIGSFYYMYEFIIKCVTQTKNFCGVHESTPDSERFFLTEFK
jgi:hypothetical protein